MQAYDIVMLIVLCVTAFLGFRRGLAWQVASVAAIVASYVVAVRFRDVVAQYLKADPPWNTFLAMLILYVATSFIIWVAFQMVRGLIDQAKLKEFDQQLGALFGLAKGALLCVIITFFAVTLLGESMKQQIIGSKSGYYIAKFLDEADAIMPEEIHAYLDPYLNQLNEELDGVDTESGGAEQGDLQQMEKWLRETPSSAAGNWLRENGREVLRDATEEFENSEPVRRLQESLPAESDPFYRRRSQATESEPSRAEVDPRQRRYLDRR